MWKLSCQKGKAGLEQCRDVETLALEEGSLSWGWRDNPDGEEDDRPCQVVGEAHVGEEHYFLTVDCADGEERAEVYSRLRRAQSGPKMTGEWE